MGGQFIDPKRICANGPAIKLVNVTRRPEAGEHYTLLRRKWFEAGEGGYGACFCCQAVNIIEYYECRGTKCDVRHMLSPVTEWSRCTGAVSRYKVDARQLLSTVTGDATGRGGNPGLSPRQLLSNVQRMNAKTVTSLLIIPSVLGFRRFVPDWILSMKKKQKENHPGSSKLSRYDMLSPGQSQLTNHL